MEFHTRILGCQPAKIGTASGGNAQDFETVMTTLKHPPFRSKAQREMDQDLQAKYGELGNPEIVAAILQKKKLEQQKSDQMHAALTPSDRD
ncbi:hypothetical protein [Kaistia terrae]|uniref:Uncharacterized protein n=1 Tax=Kaistia terrae TaxID=537017 RepID=A0ABW0PX24_9HYPH|nr:hypothetical protein [Kaistia terrae]MCX5576684.1 hypothetical protein [Kaistia terrae]